MPISVSFQSMLWDAGYETVDLPVWPVRFVNKENMEELPRTKDLSWILVPVKHKKRKPTLWNPKWEDTVQLIQRPRGDWESSDWHSHTKFVEPLKRDASLFRNFCAIEPTPNDTIRFMNENGPLFRRNVERDLRSHEPFVAWEAEVRIMRLMVEIWDAAETGKPGGIISEHFRRDANGNVQTPLQRSVSQDWWYGMRSGESASGCAAIRRFINAKDLFTRDGTLCDCAKSFVVAAVNLRHSVLGSEFALESTGGPFQLTIKPMNLLAALWAQFLGAIADGKQYRNCAVCGFAFELQPDENRTSRIYCDDACRVKAYRQRKAEALRLQRLGRTLKQIADVLESDTETVKKWLSAKKGK